MFHHLTYGTVVFKCTLLFLGSYPQFTSTIPSRKSNASKSLICATITVLTGLWFLNAHLSFLVPIPSVHIYNSLKEAQCKEEPFCCFICSTIFEDCEVMHTLVPLFLAPVYIYNSLRKGQCMEEPLCCFNCSTILEDSGIMHTKLFPRSPGVGKPLHCNSLGELETAVKVTTIVVSSFHVICNFQWSSNMRVSLQLLNGSVTQEAISPKLSLQRCHRPRAELKCLSFY